MNHEIPTPRTVVVADDESHIRAVVAAKFRASGLTVHEARDGREALNLAEQHLPHLVVTDLQMPRMSGLEFCQALRRTEATRNIPAILLTARGYILSDEEIAQTSIRLVMSKPFSARELLARAGEVLSGAAAVPLQAPARRQERAA